MTEPRADVIEAVGLEVRRGDHLALRAIDLTVPTQTMLAVTGPSGSGKSTLLGALAGVYRLSAGTLRVAGSAMGDRDEVARRGVMYLPQSGGLVSTLTTEENVVVPLLARGISPVEAAARARSALVEVGLDEEHGHLAEELSGGQQQRAGIAVLLALRPDVLLLDEPTSELDAGNRQRVLAALRVAADAGAAVVLATHDPEAAEPADAELRLEDGAARWVRALEP